MINIAHLHPVLVHLPIGIFVLVCFLHFFLLKGFTLVIKQRIIKLCLAVGIFFSIPAMLTGMLNAYRQEATFQDISSHLFFAVLTVAVSVFIYFFYNKPLKRIVLVNNFSFILLLVSIGLTGHFGGNLTHGEGYLFEATSEVEGHAHKEINSKPITHIVEIKQMKFIPAVITVSPGDSVLFINKDFFPHNVVESAGGHWASPKLYPNDSWKLKVSSEANYYCSYHMVMKGQIKLSSVVH